MKANTYVVKPFGISEVKVIALKGDPGTPTQEQINTAVDEYMTEHPEAQIPDGSITEQKLSSDVVATLNEVDNKADKVGSYPDLIAGTADNLLSSSYQTDRTPYIIRRTPFGVREKGSIVGGSMVWNQLCNNASVTVVNGHKYLLKKDGAYSIGASTGTVLTGLTVGSDMVIDLTLMFGTTIADYIYSLETATAGAGVALAKAWAGITADYYPYDEGSIKSVTGLTSHKMTGFNQFVESNLNSLSGITHTDDGWEGTGVNWNRSTNVEGWENVTYFPNTAYCATVELTTRESGSVRVQWEYTDGTSTIGSLIPANTHGRSVAVSNPAKTIKNCHLTFGSVGTGVITVHNFCINISDPSRNGQYEPYTVHTYPLDSSLTLRGLPKLDGDSIYYDGDIYKADGTVERRYYLMDMGVLDWKKSSSGNNYYANFTGLYPAYVVGAKIGVLCEKYIYAGAREASPYYGNDKELTFYWRVNGVTVCEIYVHDESFTDVASFKTAMSGVYLLYETEEPATEQEEPYTALQICDPNGTEEWVGASMPVGHDTKYYEDLKGKIEDIPDAPSADGTYTLRVTVSNGVATYSWG